MWIVGRQLFRGLWAAVEIGPRRRELYGPLSTARFLDAAKRPQDGAIVGLCVDRELGLRSRPHGSAPQVASSIRQRSTYAISSASCVFT
jgi:hypothetical protein